MSLSFSKLSSSEETTQSDRTGELSPDSKDAERVNGFMRMPKENGEEILELENF